jgi:hypothetical protein
MLVVTLRFGTGAVGVVEDGESQEEAGKDVAAEPRKQRSRSPAENCAEDFARRRSTLHADVLSDKKRADPNAVAQTW